MVAVGVVKHYIHTNKQTNRESKNRGPSHLWHWAAHRLTDKDRQTNIHPYTDMTDIHRKTDMDRQSQTETQMERPRVINVNRYIQTDRQEQKDTHRQTWTN